MGIYKKNKDLKVDLTTEDMSFKKKYIISNFGFIRNIFRFEYQIEEGCTNKKMY